MDFLVREDVSGALIEYTETASNAASDASTLQLPDPVQFLKDRGIDLPGGEHLSVEYSIDGQVQAVVGPECIGKLCACVKICEEKGKRKHCWSFCR